jgi:thiol-disulfide isomerase/thioredoxin
MQNQKGGRHNKVVGKLFATWCGHCTTLAPEWEKMKEEVKKNTKNDHIEFVEIESENLDSGLEELNKRFKTNVELKGGYPTLFKIEPGSKKVDYYNGDRQANDLIEWSTNNGRKGGNKKRTKRGKKQRRNKTQKRR